MEEELKEQQRRKAASLRRFQGEVRQRVNWHVRMRHRQELQKACEAVSEALSGETPVTQHKLGKIQTLELMSTP